jgi:O-antigen/teichoic acid export membrane protein
MNLSRMVGMMIGLVGMRFVGAGLNLVNQIVLTHIFMPADVGLIMLCMSTAAFISLFATVGYPWLALTQLPRLNSLHLKSAWQKFHGAFLHDSAKATLAIYVLVLLATLFLPLGEGSKLALLFGCLSAPASMLLRYDSAVANSIRSFTLSYAPDFIFRPALLLAYIVFTYVIGWNISVQHAMLAFVAVLYLVGVGQAIILGSNGVLPQQWFAERSKLTKALRTRAMPLALVAAVATSFSDIVTMVGGLLLPPPDVALLAVAIRLAAIAGFVIQVAQQFVLPDLSEALTLQKTETAHHLLTRLNVMTVAIIIAALVGAILFGPFALSLFGPHYVAAQSLLVAFMVGQSIRAFSGMNQQLLSIAGHQRKTVTSCLVALVMLVAGSVLGVRHFGLVGIGFAVIAAELAWSLMLAAQAQNLTGRRGDLFWLLTNRA